MGSNNITNVNLINGVDIDDKLDITGNSDITKIMTNLYDQYLHEFSNTGAYVV